MADAHGPGQGVVVEPVAALVDGQPVGQPLGPVLEPLFLPLGLCQCYSGHARYLLT